MPKWNPGQSGNPKGRPVKDRTFAHLLERELAHKFNGVPKKKLWLTLLADALATGRIKFPEDEKQSVISLETWASLSFKTLAHLEPPPKEIELKSDEPIELIVKYVNRDTPSGTA